MMYHALLPATHAAIFCFFSAASLFSPGLDTTLTVTFFFESTAPATDFILYTGTADAAPSTRSNAPVSSCKNDLFHTKPHKKLVRLLPSSIASPSAKLT